MDRSGNLIERLAWSPAGLRSGWLGLVLIAVAGCSTAEPPDTPAPPQDSEPAAGAGELPPIPAELPPIPAELPPIPAELPPLEPPPAQPLTPWPAPDASPPSVPASALEYVAAPPQEPDGAATTGGAGLEPIPLRKLRDDLTPLELVDFLASADKDMELIHSGRGGLEDPGEIRQTLLQIVNLKLQAARRLIAHPASTPQQRSEGKRGELQSLSHLAALSDVKAAEELELLAAANMDSDDPQLVADSRLVLVGFAIEALQNGKGGAAERMMTYIDQIAGSDSAADVPALIVMGQARQALANYGHAELAQQVRDKIIEKFADSANPDVASIAAQLAGNVQYDGVDRLRGEMLDGGQVDVQSWTGAVETLIQESPDLQTVRYLAAAAVDLESAGLNEPAMATLQVLQSRFQEPDAATTREVETAIQATAARRDIIGQPLQIDLPSLSGAPLSLRDYRGKVVLMPCWGTGIPLSLQPLESLQSIRDQYPEQVAIVGVNLDPPDVPVEEFLQSNQLDFPSFALGERPESPLPRQLGMVSMPFVVVLGRDGTVAAVLLSDRNLRQTVDSLVGP